MALRGTGNGSDTARKGRADLVAVVIKWKDTDKGADSMWKGKGRDVELQGKTRARAVEPMRKRHGPDQWHRRKELQ